MKILLEGLLPRLYPDLSFLCVPHEGKRDLEQSVSRKLRAWREPGVRFCVIRDNDGADCRALQRTLVALCESGGRADTLVRIACQELEAWYLGAPEALAIAFENKSLSRLGRLARFRDPDTVVGPSAALAKRVPEFQKVSGARRMARVMSRESASPSFRFLLAGIDRLSDDMRTAQGED